MFDPFFYLKHNRDVRLADVEPLKHFIQFGWKEGRDPSEFFDTCFYLENNPDVEKAGINPLYHFLLFGFLEGRKAKSSYDAYFYWRRLNGYQKGLFNIIKQYKNAIIIHKSGLFDKDFYFRQNPDVQKAFTKSIYWKWRNGKNPLLRVIGKFKTSSVIHYVFHGACENRDPNSCFSTSFYINQYPDLRKVKNLNPFVHYIRFGQFENCLTNPNLQQEVLTDLLQYSSGLIREYSEQLQAKQVTVIIEAGEDWKDLHNRLENVLSQTHQHVELFIVDWQEDPKIVDLIGKYVKTHPQKINYFTASEQRKKDSALFKEALQQATSEFIWIVPEGNICDDNFLDELLVYFADESVMAAYSPTKILVSQTKASQKPPLTAERWIKSASQWVNQRKYFDDELQLYRAACIFRNIFMSDLVTKEIPALQTDENFRNFLLQIINGGAIAFSDSATHWMKEQVISPRSDESLMVESWMREQELLSIVRTQYQVPLQKIEKNYEKDRGIVLIHDPSQMEDFIEKYDIEKIIREDVHLNIMISVVAFSLGGGEIMPIRLANQLKQIGQSVIIHSLRSSERVAKVRDMLDPSIPVVTTNKVKEMALILKEFDINVINTHHQANQSFIASVLNSDKQLHQKIFHVGTSHGMYENFPENTLRIIYDRIKDGVDHWTYVADKNTLPFKQHGLYRDEKFTKIPNGMKIPRIQPIDITGLGIFPESFVGCVASRAIPEKGWLQAIQAIKLARQISGKDIHLLLIGDGEIYQQLLKESLPEYIHLLGFRDNPCDYYAISDVCLIPSFYRSESAPLSLIESLLCHKPVISSDIGDVVKMLTINGELAGDVFKLDNWTVPVDVLANKIVNYATDTDLYQKKVALVKQKAQEFDIVNIAKKYLQVYQTRFIDNTTYDKMIAIQTIDDDNQMLNNAVKAQDSIKVSVIVPNYNHAKYLRQRLDSIYNQTYRNFEVLLLDDCSSDNSRLILQEYAERYSENTCLLFNEKNSGGVYYQWAKGILNASSDYCWIAESDDYCEPNFLEKVMRAFRDLKVHLSYCQYGFVNEDGVENSNAFFNYVGAINDQKWRTSYIIDANKEVSQALAIKNTIPNASGAVFKKPDDLSLLEDENWLSMHICGDWIFYLHLAQGGKVAYTTKTKSYFRFHTSNTSVATYATAAYYKEHEMVACTVKGLFDVDDAVIIQNYENIRKFFTDNVKDKKLVFEELYDLKKVLAVKKIQTPLKRKIGFVNDPSVHIYNESSRTVLVNPIFSSDKKFDSPLADRVLVTGSNTGNMLFVESMKEQLNYIKEIWVRAFLLEDLEGDFSIVLPSSNFIINGSDSFINVCTQFLQQTSHPFTMAGLGAQASKELDTPKKLVKALSPAKIQFFKMAAERAVTLGIRGEFTAQCLEEMGIHNYRIIGCPSVYKSLIASFPDLPQPNSNKVLMSITTGSKMETHILKLGMSVNAKWIIQMMSELPEMAFEDKLVGDSEIEKRFPGITISNRELQLYMKKNAAIFFRINDWNNYIQEEEFTFAFGSRFHGNMCALRNGVPALWIVHDSRTTELVNTLHLPHIDHTRFEKVNSVQELVDLCDYSDFCQHYTEMARNYIQFLDENHLEHRFDRAGFGLE